MLFVHENNLQNKIRSDYKGQGTSIQQFYDETYKPVHDQLMKISFAKGNDNSVRAAATIFNEYYDKLRSFSSTHEITSQSKFESTFLEEMSSYLFKDIEKINDGSLGVFISAFSPE